MDRSKLIILASLLLIVIAFPFYALAEPLRMETARAALQQELVVGAAPTYLDHCATCHGADGGGLAAVPSLHLLAEADAGAAYLYETIAHAAHGSTMSAWHSDDGGVLTAYEIRELVALIRVGDWDKVETIAVARGQAVTVPAPLPADDSYLLSVAESDPHRCVACHEEPVVHAGQFGLECSRCHATTAWRPALLTRHLFDLEHGDTGLLSCQTCHVETYTTHDCTTCHEHDAAEMEAVHLAEGIAEFDACATCHPTGAPGEADQLRLEGYIQVEVNLPGPGAGPPATVAVPTPAPELPLPPPLDGAAPVSDGVGNSPDTAPADSPGENRPEDAGGNGGRQP